MHFHLLNFPLAAAELDPFFFADPALSSALRLFWLDVGDGITLGDIYTSMKIIQCK